MPSRFTIPAVAALLLCVAQASASAAECSVSPTKKDLAQGLSIVADATCVDDGIGCIATNCRYCRLSATASNGNLLLCSSVVAVPLTAVPSSIAPAPTTVVMPSPASSAPTIDACAVTVSSGDLAMGVSAAIDSSCAVGGLGCFSSSCRFCRLFDTTLSASFVECTSLAAASPPPAPAFDLTCSTTASPGDAAAGIAVVTDVSCALGGVGCLSDVCRFCQVWASASSIQFIRCSNVDTNDGSDIFFTPLPPTGQSNGIVIGSTDRPMLDQIIVSSTSTTLAPSTTLTPPTTSAPPTTLAPSTSPPALDMCAQTVSTGDAAVGISAATDPSCQSGGLGCFSTSCRFCKLYDSPQSSYLLACASLR